VKRVLICLVILSMFGGVCWGQVYISGALSGVLEDTTYIVEGDIWVEEGDSLVIEAGAEFFFDDSASMKVYGYLVAIGSENDSINFTCQIGDENWKGIKFFNTADDSSIIMYCCIEYSIESGILLDSASPKIQNNRISYCYSPDFGGGIKCMNSNPSINSCLISENQVDFDVYACGGGIALLDYSCPTISNCIISNNTAYRAGGVFCEMCSNPNIDNTQISFNYANHSGGGIYTREYSTPNFNICNISYNSVNYKGGGINAASSSAPVFNNCLINNNSAGIGGAICNQLASYYVNNCVFYTNDADSGSAIYRMCGWVISINSSIFYENQSPVMYFACGSWLEVAYNCIYPETDSVFAGNVPYYLGKNYRVNSNGDSCDVYNNIFLDPLFYSTTGDSAFYLTSESPCIDAGDPESPLDPDSTIADIGAFYFDQTLVIENLTITIFNDDVMLDWEDVPGAAVYHIYRSEDPYFDIMWMTPIGDSGISEYLDEDILEEGPQFYRLTWE